MKHKRQLWHFQLSQDASRSCYLALLNNLENFVSKVGVAFFIGWSWVGGCYFPISLCVSIFLLGYSLPKSPCSSMPSHFSLRLFHLFINAKFKGHQFDGKLAILIGCMQTLIFRVGPQNASRTVQGQFDSAFHLL